MFIQKDKCFQLIWIKINFPKKDANQQIKAL